MGVEVLGDELIQVPVKDGSEGDGVFIGEKETGKLKEESEGQVLEEPIKFGSHGTDVPVKGEGVTVTDANFPKDAADEWPAPKQIHYFYLVKFRSYEDPKLKTKIDQADKEIQKKNQARFQIVEELKAKKSERAHVISQLKPLTLEDKQYRIVVDEKRKEMEPLHQALGKLRTASNANRERGAGLCSSEEELNDLIQSLHYQIQHESNTLVEEKQLIREIKQLESTREKVITNAAMKAKIQDSFGQRDAIQDQVKLIGVDLDGVRKEKQAVRAKIKILEDELKLIDDEIGSLQEELTALTQKRDKAYEGLTELRKQRDEGNAHFYQNRSLLNHAKELAAKKDIAALEELSNTEVEKFMSLWSSNKGFRDDYEKRILPSLDIRQLSRDGRMRNPDEKPLVPEAPRPTEPETVVKPNIKRPKEDSKAPSHENVQTRKVQKEDNNKLTESETTTKSSDLEDKENTSSFEKPQKELPKTAVIDVEKLKEIKREEEIAKAKLASERKKKLAEKAAAKAAARAQKEAEKKLKEREKRAKKKAGISAPTNNPEEQIEGDTEVVEQENADVNVEAPVPSKNKELKENLIRSRNRSKGQGSLPKVILNKRKKSMPYWVWAAPAVVLVLMLMVLGYYYLI